MASNNQVQIVLLNEVMYCLLGEDEGGTTVIRTPSFSFNSWNHGSHTCGWIGPEKVAQEAAIWDLRGPWDGVNFGEFVEVRGYSSMHAQYSVLYESSHRQVVEKGDEAFPQLESIPSPALLPEAVDPRYILAFVVASQHEDTLWVLEFVDQKEAKGFY